MTTDLRLAAEAAELLASRQADDGLVALGLFDHQRRFVASTKDEAWLFGANRSGKTEALATLIASMARWGTLDPSEAVRFPTSRPVRVWAVSLTFDMSRNILQAKLFNNGARIDRRPPLIPDSEILSWNITNQTLRLKNGSVILFKSCDGGRDSFQGADVDLIAFDEVPDEDVYKECLIRIGGGRRLWIRGAATILPPAGVPGGVSWMYPAKVQPWIALGKTEDERNARTPRLDVVSAGLRHNPTILPEEIERLASVFAPGTPEYMIRVEGALLPSIGGALVYPHFHRRFHVREELAPEFDGVRQPVLVPHLPLCLCVDFNPENGVWTIGQRVGKVFRVLDEIMLERSDILSMTHEFRTRYPYHDAELWIYGDATGRRREGQTGTSSFHLIQQYLVGYPSPITFRLPDVNPPVKDRTDAVNLQMRPPSGERLLEISPLCPETIKDFEGTKWTRKLQIDKKHGRRSDGADTVGYWISYEEPVRTALREPSRLRSVRSPVYMHGSSSGPFPSTQSRPVRIGNRWYGRRIGA